MLHDKVLKKEKKEYNVTIDNMKPVGKLQGILKVLTIHTIFNAAKQL